MASTDTATQLLAQGTWNIDPAHSSLQFSVRHLMISKVKGSFTKFEGTVTVPENPYEAVADVTFDPASIETGDPHGTATCGPPTSSRSRSTRRPDSRRRRSARRATTTSSRATSTSTA